MKKIVILATVLCMAVLSINGQDQFYALRYSQNFISGTARYTAMGGAFGAVGGDFTAASVNPAGLGLFRSSEFTITPAYTISNSKTSFLDEVNNNVEYNLTIGNMGLVTTLTRPENGVGVVLGFGYNALNNFDRTMMMSGINTVSSQLDNFSWYANNYNELNTFYEGLANDMGLVFQFDDETEYTNDFAEYGYGQEQKRILEHSGFIGEYAFSGAINLGHRLYIGGTFGIHSLRFYEDIYHTESDIGNNSPSLDSYEFNEYNSTRGTGYVFKVGVVFKPIHALRLGAAFHSPVRYNLTQSKYTDISTFWDSDSGYENSSGASGSGPFYFDYTLRTPYRASASAAFVLGKIGLVSAEYEYADYSTSDLEPLSDFDEENLAITKDFKAAHTLKAGAEVRLNPIYLRAGAQYYTNPNAITVNGSDVLVYAGGLGYRSGQTYVDLAYSLTTGSDLYGLYFYNNLNGNDLETAEINYRVSKLMVTLGFRF
jgi:hypothetical protein